MSGVDQPARLRLDSLDALRGIAALAVAWFHIVQKSGDPDIASETLRLVLHWTSAYGWLGVPAFFVLTGFIIPYATLRNPATPGNAGVFLVKRFLRLYPPFAATVALALALMFAAPLLPGFRGEIPDLVTPAYVAGNLALLTPLFGEPWLVPVFWSLLVEVQYYLVIAVAILAAARWRGPDLTVPCCLAATLLALVVPHQLHAVTSYGSLFVIGHALYRHQAGRGRLVENAGLVGLALVVTAVALGPVYLLPTAPTIVVVLLRPNLGRALLFLGTISYSLYLTHYFIGTRAVRLIERFVAGDWGHAVAYLGAMAIAVVAAWIFYRAVERPSVEWSARVGYDVSPPSKAPRALRA